MSRLFIVTKQIERLELCFLCNFKILAISLSPLILKALYMYIHSPRSLYGNASFSLGSLKRVKYKHALN